MNVRKGYITTTNATGHFNNANFSLEITKTGKGTINYCTTVSRQQVSVTNCLSAIGVEAQM